MNQSAQLFSRARSVIPGGVNSPVRAFRNVDGDPFFVQSAKGAYITDADGRQLIDYIGTWGPAILGHAPQPVLDAVHAAVDRGLGYGIPAPAEVDMAEMITDMVPSVEKVRMVNSGTEATMSAIRLARGYTGRRKIIKFIGCYHGHVDSLLVAAGSGALTFGEPDSAGVPREMTQLTLTVPYNDREAVKKAFELHGSDIAAVILEPFPANAGLYFPQNDFLHFLREITLRHDTLLIFDEVMTGFRSLPEACSSFTASLQTLPAWAKSSAEASPWELLAAARKSWTASLRLALCIRREPCPAIRSPWRRDWPSSGNS